MNVLMTGATGFIGQALVRRWMNDGHRVTALVRSQHRAAELLAPEVSLVSSLDEISNDTVIDIVVNLAGAPIAARPWTKSRRKELLASRLGTTKDLVSLISRLTTKPELMISASATGYYGRRGASVLSEEVAPQDIFMSTLCRKWEEAAAPVTEMGVRLVIPRISVVLGSDGGAFPSLVRPIRFGLGTRFGAGGHYFPWIHKQDLLAVLDHIIKNKAVSGPLNAVAPNTVTQHQFNQCFAKHLGRPNFMWMPAAALKLMLGEMADLFIAGQHMSAEKLINSGFEFQYPTLEKTAADLLNKQ
jgi:uncharacterized protein (TIGR01777 family)